jgi:hypothetical protein
MKHLIDIKYLNIDLKSEQIIYKLVDIILNHIQENKMELVLQIVNENENVNDKIKNKNLVLLETSLDFRNFFKDKTSFYFINDKVQTKIKEIFELKGYSINIEKLNVPFYYKFKLRSSRCYNYKIKINKHIF